MNLKWAPVRPGGRAAAGAAAFAECKQTRMACSRTATNSHAEKSGRGAGGAGAAGGRVVSGSAAEGRTAEGRSTAASQQTRGMWSEQLERESHWHEDPMCRWRRRRQAHAARLTNFSPFILQLI
jgi:hypothetical protein